jgi:hypothetical protein
VSLLLVLILGFFLVVAVAAGSGFWTGRIWERDRAAKEEADALEEELAWQAELRSLPPGPLRPFPADLVEHCGPCEDFECGAHVGGCVACGPDVEPWSVPLEYPPAGEWPGAADVGQMRPETVVETTGAHDFGEWIANWQKINRQWESEGFPT